MKKTTFVYRLKFGTSTPSIYAASWLKLSVADPGCLSWIQIFFHPGSRIRIKEFKYFNPKNCFQALGNMIRVVHPGSGS
jgi:hypothetical protein